MNQLKILARLGHPLYMLSGKYLLITNTVSCGLMMGFGDLIQQRNDYWKRHYYKYLPSGRVMAASPELYANNESIVLSKVSSNKEGSLYKHDYVRTKNMVIVGLFQGPFHHYFYLMLDRILPGRSAMTIIKKTCLDQSIASPTCLGIFFIGLGLLEQRNLKDIQNEIKLKFWETWKVRSLRNNFCFSFYL